MNNTMTDHRVQTENPMCSEITEYNRFRFAILRPVRCQKSSSSGSQWSTHRPGNRLRRDDPASGGPAVAGTHTSGFGSFRLRTTVGTQDYSLVAACDARAKARSHRRVATVGGYASRVP